MLMPVADLRTETQPSPALREAFRSCIFNYLKKKGYTVITADSYAEGKDVKPHDLGSMAVAELALLGPKDERTLLFLFIENAASKGDVLKGESSEVVGSALLIDKEQRLLLWKDRAKGEADSGSLLGSLLFGGVAGLAGRAASSGDIGTAVNRWSLNIFASFPDSPAVTTGKELFRPIAEETVVLGRPAIGMVIVLPQDTRFHWKLRTFTLPQGRYPAVAEDRKGVCFRFPSDIVRGKKLHHGWLFLKRGNDPRLHVAWMYDGIRTCSLPGDVQYSVEKN